MVSAIRLEFGTVIVRAGARVIVAFVIFVVVVGGVLVLTSW